MPEPCRHRIPRAAPVMLVGAWAVAVSVGLWQLWGYAGAAGAAAAAPAQWPAGSRVPRGAGLPTLVLFAHPHCPCSRATVGELARLMATRHGKLAAAVVVLRPAGVPEGWERTDLWRSAAAVPGVTVVADDGGAEARRFGAATSGQTLLYGEDGRLLFAGGITESRGHSGDNAGRSAVAFLLSGGAPDHPAGLPAGRTPVYGCPLFNEPDACAAHGDDQAEGSQACHHRP